MRRIAAALLLLLPACDGGLAIPKGGGDLAAGRDMAAGPADLLARDMPVGCTSDADCASDPGGKVCDRASGRCGACSTESDACPASQHCDPKQLTCVDGCRSDEGCAAGGAVDLGGVNPDGGSPGLRVCDTTAHVCVECLVDGNCPSGKLCVDRVCAAGCSAAQPCAGGETCCDGACVATATSATHCGACGNACKAPNATAVCTDSTCKVSTCDGTFGDCNGTFADGCETDTSMAVEHCGMCGRPCSFPNAVGACTAGNCAITSCQAGWGDCDSNPANGCEVDLRVAVSNCGTCGTACAAANGTATCAMGKCAVESCATGWGDCDGDAGNGCEANLAGSATHCGKCGDACKYDHATPLCNAGACAMGACDKGFADCDKDPKNGCETDLSTTMNCGTCGNACAFANAAATCDAGACKLGACDKGFADCDADPKNGCEINLSVSVKHCSKCGLECVFPGASATCLDGVCVKTNCDAGKGDCDGVTGNGCETNTTTDVKHCGACGSACVLANATPRCVDSACAISACNAGFGDCNYKAADGCEIDTRSNPSHCGACDKPCSLAHATAGCASSACTVASCAANYDNCDGLAPNGCEVDLRTDAKNCGKCGNACSFANAAASCVSSACAMGACNAGYGDCDKDAKNGCETPTTADPANCGACGRVCASGKCVSGACSVIGDGADGNLSVTTDTTFSPTATYLTAGASSGAASVSVASTAGFAVGQEVLVVDMRGAEAGRRDFARVTSVGGGALGLAPALTGAYPATDKVQVVRVYHYGTVNISSSGTLRAPAWNGTVGGVIAMRATDTATINGNLFLSGRGYVGGPGDGGGNACRSGIQGESPSGAGAVSTARNGGGGGGGQACGCCNNCGHSPGGGGGAFGVAGNNGTGECTVGVGGAVYGDTTFDRFFMGAGGGAGAGNCGVTSGSGGNGGGILYLAATTITVGASATVESRGTVGGNGGGWEGGGGGGAGGSVFLLAPTMTLPAGRVVASGAGTAGSCAGMGGVGGAGRVRLACTTLNGAACPGVGGAATTPAATVVSY